MTDFEYTNKYIKERFAHEARRQKLGKEKFQELLVLKDKSRVPFAFHVGSVLLLPLRGIDYPAQDIVFRLAGLRYTDFKSSSYAILYAQAMSLIKVAEIQAKNRNLWPANLYTIQLDDSLVSQKCADLALEESTDYQYVINPSPMMRLHDLISNVTRKTVNSFDPIKIMNDVESAFTNPNQVSKLNYLVRVELQKSGMPKGW